MPTLVTGGLGFIGAYVVRGLIEQGEAVATLDLSVSGNQAHTVLSAEELSRLAIYQGDASDPHQVARVVRQCEADAIVHLAVVDDFEGHNPAAASMADTRAFLNVLEAGRSLGVRRIVWASSDAVFGSPRFHGPGPIANDAPHHPGFPYAICKSFNEQMAEHYWRTFAVDAIGLRFGYVYGHGRRLLINRPEFDSRLFGAPFRGERAAVPLADSLISWQYVEDAAGSISAALRSTGPLRARTFNTCGTTMVAREVAAIVQRHLPDAQFDFEPGGLDFPGETDDTLAIEDLGYRQRFPIEVGVPRTLDLMRERLQSDAAIAAR
jgi:UDP-glucose 4-epimerase